MAQSSLLILDCRHKKEPHPIGLSHKSRHNYDSPIAFLETWLRNAAATWIDAYAKEHPKNAFESMRDWMKMRDEREAEEFKSYWPKIKARDEVGRQERLEELRNQRI